MTDQSVSIYQEHFLLKSSTLRNPQRADNQSRLEMRQEQILEAAARLFAEHGYSATDTQLLADHLEVGKGTLYRYFPSKEELFLATVDRVMRELCQQCDASIAGIDDPLDQIAAGIKAYLRFFAEYPAFVELLIQERAQFKERKKPTYFEYREANLPRWQEIYRQLIAQGKVRNVPVERITDVLSEVLYGTIFVNYFSGQQKSYEAQAHDIIDIAFCGILTPEERRHRGLE
jgi:AcrR family transcriptional regulator